MRQCEGCAQESELATAAPSAIPAPEASSLESTRLHNADTPLLLRRHSAINPSVSGAEPLVHERCRKLCVT